MADGPRDTTEAIVGTRVYSTADTTKLAVRVANASGSDILGVALDTTNDSIKSIVGSSATVGGLDTDFRSALTNTVVSVKASAGNVYSIFSYNSGAGYVFIQVFDVAAASVTLGTTTPKYIFAVPATGVYDNSFPCPITHATAISMAATATATGNGAPSATQAMWMGYK